MKRLIGTALIAMLSAACSSSSSGTTGGTGTGTTGGATGGTGTGTTGGIACGPGPCVAINSVDIFPPAKAWLTANNLPIPDIFQTSVVFDAGYVLELYGTSLSASGVQLTLFNQIPLNSSTPPPPYVFGIDAGSPDGLGLVAAIAIATGDGGSPAVPMLTCANLALALDAGSSAVAGYFDYIVPAGTQPGKPLTAPSGPVGGTVYAVPASFVAQMSCAAGIDTVIDGGLIGGGIGLFYFTQSPYGIGAPITGASIDNMGNGLLVYYSNDFSSGSATGPTDATGVAVVSAVTPQGSGLPPNFVLTSPGQNLSPAPVQTNQGAILEIFPYQVP